MDKRWISGGSAGVRFSLSDLFQRIRRRFGRDGLFLDHVAHMEGLDELPEGSHVHMHVLQLPRSPAPNGNVSAFPQTNLHLRRNENLHFTLYLQRCGDFHAPKIGEAPRRGHRSSTPTLKNLLVWINSTLSKSMVEAQGPSKDLEP